ncbi:collagenase [Galliscardovia ingluviei]|uniref:Collagenase n=1 Tax=Galliscardovia ingluviei TaxID=1769422 RepID=A0A8J3EZ57_9BIFI|nr:U32 family peptidase [Galliscardovia ingluviei]GGI14071.1 collagenase [Galliscardovia ingluviei]
MKARRIPEVLAPAGNLRGLKTAVDFHADAVYCGGKAFGMRTAPKNLSLEDFEEGARYAHECGARVYVTCNVLPRNDEIEQMRNYIGELKDTGIDAVIVTDIGVLMMVHQIAPNLEIHVSTQAGVTNYGAAQSLYALGARRVVLAREMDIQAIRDIRANIPDDMDIECFVHGSMCMAFSGRCLISNYLTGRDGNHGECAQPCRWKYSLVEEKRPGQYFPVEETNDGTYIFNSQDMNMIEHIDDVLDAGATSLKIEGRAKSAYYVAAMTNAYKIAVNEYMVQRGFEDTDGNTLQPYHHQVITMNDVREGRITLDQWNAAGDKALAQSNEAFSVMPDMEAPVLQDTANEQTTAEQTAEADADINVDAASGWEHARSLPQPHIHVPQWVLDEPYKVAHREYSTGFYYPDNKVSQHTETSRYIRDWMVVGEVLSWKDGRLTIMSRNKIEPGQRIEILLPGTEPLVWQLPAEGIEDADGNPVDVIRHPARVYSFPFPHNLPENAMLRSPIVKKAKPVSAVQE